MAKKRSPGGGQSRRKQSLDRRAGRLAGLIPPLVWTANPDIVDPAEPGLRADDQDDDDEAGNQLDDDRGGRPARQGLALPRPLVISGSIGYGTVQMVAARMLTLPPDRRLPLVVIINSPGGLVDCGLAIYDYLTGCGRTVVTATYGAAHSIASVIFQAGDERLIAPQATIHLHNAFTYVESDLDFEMVDQLRRRMAGTQRRLERLLVGRSGRPLAEVSEWCRKNRLFTAREAVTHGLADQVIRRRPKPRTR